MITPTEAEAMRGIRFTTMALESAEKHIDDHLGNDLVTTTRMEGREGGPVKECVIDLEGFSNGTITVMVNRYRALGWGVEHVPQKVVPSYRYRFWYTPRGPIDHKTFAP